MTQSSEQLVASISALTEEWGRTMLDGNWDNWAELITDDIVLLPPESPVVVGKEAAKAFMATFPVVKEFNAEVVQAEGSGDLAVARGTFSLMVESEPGETIPMTGKWIAHYRQQPDGSWLCASDTWNLDAP